MCVCVRYWCHHTFFTELGCCCLSHPGKNTSLVKNSWCVAHITTNYVLEIGKGAAEGENKHWFSIWVWLFSFIFPQTLIQHVMTVMFICHSSEASYSGKGRPDSSTFLASLLHCIQKVLSTYQTFSAFLPSLYFATFPLAPIQKMHSCHKSKK